MAIVFAAGGEHGDWDTYDPPCRLYRPLGWEVSEVARMSATSVRAV
jgi:hypothetical protein